MDCFIYKSPKKPELYLFVAKENDFEVVPAPLMQGFGKPEFVMRLELSAERKLARSDVAEVMSNLREKGFWLQMPPRDPAIDGSINNEKLRR